MAMLLNIPISDVLFLAAKTEYDGSKPCRKTKKTVVTTKMKEFLESYEWKKLSQWDRLLHKAANASLDMTIDRLGRYSFQRKLDQYRAAQKLVNERCVEKTVLPCTGGIFHPPNETDCLYRDSACAMNCLDEVAAELNLLS